MQLELSILKEKRGRGREKEWTDRHRTKYVEVYSRSLLRLVTKQVVGQRSLSVLCYSVEVFAKMFT